MVFKSEMIKCYEGRKEGKKEEWGFWSNAQGGGDYNPNLSLLTKIIKVTRYGSKMEEGTRRS